MAASLIITTSLLFAEFTGWIQILWVALGTIGFASILIPKLRHHGVILGISALISTSWIARDWFTFSASLFILLLYRCLHNPVQLRRDNFTIFIFWSFVGGLAFARQLPLIATISLVGLLSTAPIPSIQAPRWTGKIASWIALALVCGHFIYQPMKSQEGRVAYLEHGKWANAGEAWNMNNLNMRSAYSYSELLRLLNADRIDISSLGSEFNEAWMITPTSPLSSAEISSLQNWIKDGGSLILITDHTDVFGHGRVANQLLDRFGIQTDYTAFFPTRQDDGAQDGWGGEYKMRTSTTFKGYGAFPFITARWFNEAADYSTKNFFGRLRATGEDEHSRRMIMGFKAFGRGRLVLMADSTMFSNFATYAPDSIRIASYLRSSFYLTTIYSLFPGLLLTTVFCCRLEKQGILVLLSVYAAMFMIGAPNKHGSLSWGRNEDFLWWSGDSNLVQGERSPEKSLSTAYICSSLSTTKPRWTSSTKGISTGGIWVSSEPPPNEGWRWLSPAGSTNEFEVDEALYHPLYDALDVAPLRKWNEGSSGAPLHSGGIWTNEVLGDEWFDRGLSPARTERFKAFLSWITNDPVPARTVAIAKGTTSLWNLKLPSQDARSISLPLPPGENGKIIYLGRGISGQWVTIENVLCLVGPKPYMESWHAPEMWILQPANKKPLHNPIRSTSSDR